MAVQLQQNSFIVLIPGTFENGFTWTQKQFVSQ